MKESAEPVDYVYILAASHSGSTLSALLLNAHPDVVSVGEVVSGSTRVLEGYRCSCRRLITECPFWRRVVEEMRPFQPTFDLADFDIGLRATKPWWLSRALRMEHRGPVAEGLRDLLVGLSPSGRDRMRRAEDRLARLARTVMALRQARFFVDSSKLAHRLRWVLRMPSLRVKVIHLVRDGRAVALTYMDERNFADAADPSLRRGGRGDSTSTRAMSMDRAAEEWRRAARSAEHLLAGLDPSQWKRVSYEALCQDPDATLRGVLAFIGADPARMRRDFRAIENHVVGNGMRLDSTSEIRLDERWREILTPAELSAFEAVAGDQNRRFGYR